MYTINPILFSISTLYARYYGLSMHLITIIYYYVYMYNKVSISLFTGEITVFRGMFMVY